MASDEIRDPGGNLLTPASSTEDAVMAGLGHHKIFLSVGRNSRAEIVGGLGLARTRDVVELTLDG
jgi:hypothetical protein